MYSFEEAEGLSPLGLCTVNGSYEADLGGEGAAKVAPGLWGGGRAVCRETGSPSMRFGRSRLRKCERSRTPCRTTAPPSSGRSAPHARGFGARTLAGLAWEGCGHDDVDDDDDDDDVVVVVGGSTAAVSDSDPDAASADETAGWSAETERIGTADTGKSAALDTGVGDDRGGISTVSGASGRTPSPPGPAAARAPSAHPTSWVARSCGSAAGAPSEHSSRDGGTVGDCSSSRKGSTALCPVSSDEERPLEEWPPEERDERPRDEDEALPSDRPADRFGDFPPRRRLAAADFVARCCFGPKAVVMTFRRAASSAMASSSMHCFLGVFWLEPLMTSLCGTNVRRSAM